MASDSPASIVGKRLAKLRKQHGITLRALEAKSGTSASLLSQIENGKTNPSVMTLQNIATALDVPVKYFFDADDQDAGDQNAGDQNAGDRLPHVASGPVSTAPPYQGAPGASSAPGSFMQHPCEAIVHPANRVTIELEGGVVWERLTADKEDGVEFIEVIYEVGTSSGPAMASHHGRECAMVLEGELLLEIGDERYTLQPGDSMAFDSMLPHRVSNAGNTRLRVFWGNLSP